MKFDPTSWNEVKPNENHEALKGWLRVRFSAPCPLYIETHGVEALVGVGTAFDVEVAEAFSWKVIASGDVRVFVFETPDTTHKCEGTVFTNIDRMPEESGSLLEVKKALRMFELQKRDMLREIRQERDRAVAATRAAQQAQDPVLETDPDPANADDQGAAE